MSAYDIAAQLPSVEVLRSRCQALAVLERIADGIQPYYAYGPWGDDQAAQMTNGSGDEWTIVFTGGGAFIRVFDHESAMSPYGDDDLELWPGLLDGLPDAFRPQIEEPAFTDDGSFVATAVLWRRHGDERWQAGDGIEFPPSRGPYDTDPDGTAMLKILLDDIVDGYLEFTGDYYGTTVSRTHVEHIVEHRPLTDDLVRSLNPDLTAEALRDDLAEIGYPSPALR